MEARACYDVCILGGGLSGLSCARKLLRERPSTSVVILEARDRVGGRTLSVPASGNAVVDLGGQWVGPAQPRCLELIRDLELALVKQPWFDDEHATILSSGSSIPLTKEENQELEAINAQLEKWAESVREPASWSSVPRAAEWDSLSIAQFFDGAVKSSTVRRELDQLVRTVTASEPRDLSLLYFLFFLGSCGGLAGSSRVPHKTLSEDEEAESTWNNRRHPRWGRWCAILRASRRRAAAVTADGTRVAGPRRPIALQRPCRRHPPHKQWRHDVLC